MSFLEKGDTIGIIALAGDCDRKKIEKSEYFLGTMGYRVKLSKNIYDADRYLAGSDSDKIEALYDMFEDPQVKLILNARGGYGTLRLLNKIDYDRIKSNPKPFCGYSDITALLLTIYNRTGIITYHSPMAESDFGIIPKEDEEFISFNNFVNTLNSKPIRIAGEKLYKNGFASGVLIGGNLATIASMCGLDFIPEKNFIFFAEDLNEPVYKIDRMFRQIMNIEKFQQYCKGIIFGDFLSVDNEKWLNSLIKEIVSELDIPALSINGITHNKDKLTLPIGAKAVISGNLFGVM